MAELERRLIALSPIDDGTRENLAAERTTVEAALGALIGEAESTAALKLTASPVNESEPAVVPDTTLTPETAGGGRNLNDVHDAASVKLLPFSAAPDARTIYHWPESERLGHTVAV